MPATGVPSHRRLTTQPTLMEFRTMTVTVQDRLISTAKINGAELIFTSATMRDVRDPAILSVQLGLMRRNVEEITKAIASVEAEHADALASMSRARGTDEHQLDIEDGVASFEAYRAKREAQ